MVGLFLYVGEKPSTYGLPLFVTFVRSDQAAAHFTLPAGGCNYLRWVTTALCCTG